MRSLLIAILLFTFGMSTPTATSVTASEHDAKLPRPDLEASAPVYLALGDSLAFGAGATDPVTSGYVPLVHDGLRASRQCPGCDGLQLLNLAENGATTETLQETQLPAALSIIEARNSDDDRTNDVVTVTITIGGNDAFGSLIRICSSSINAICAEQVREVIGQIERNITDILRQLRAAAGPETSISVMTYFNSLIDCDFQDAAPNADLVLEGDPDLSRGLNEVIRQAAARADATVAETYGQLERDDLIGGVDCLHANDAGYVKIADAFLEAILHENPQ